MAQDKMLMQINAKLDALLEKSGLKPADFEQATAAPAPRKLTAAEQQAIDNAPETPVGANEPMPGPRVNTMNAPETPAATPKAKSRK